MSIPIVHLVSHVTDQGYSLEQGARVLSVLFNGGVREPDPASASSQTASAACVPS